MKKKDAKSRMYCTAYSFLNNKPNTGRYTPECLTEWEQVKHVSTLVFTENNTTLLCQ